MSEEKLYRPITPEEQMKLWEETFEFIEKRTEEMNVDFNLFDLNSMIQRGIADISKAELYPYIEETLTKISDSSIPKNVFTKVTEIMDYLIKEGATVKESSLNNLEVFYLISSVVYMFSETLDFTLQDAASRT